MAQLPNSDGRPKTFGVVWVLNLLLPGAGNLYAAGNTRKGWYPLLITLFLLFMVHWGWAWVPLWLIFSVYGMMQVVDFNERLGEYRLPWGRNGSTRTPAINSDDSEDSRRSATAHLREVLSDLPGITDDFKRKIMEADLQLRNREDAETEEPRGDYSGYEQDASRLDEEPAEQVSAGDPAAVDRIYDDRVQQWLRKDDGSHVLVNAHGDPYRGSYTADEKPEAARREHPSHQPAEIPHYGRGDATGVNWPAHEPDEAQIAYDKEVLERLGMAGAAASPASSHSVDSDITQIRMPEFPPPPASSSGDAGGADRRVHETTPVSPRPVEHEKGVARVSRVASAATAGGAPAASDAGADLPPAGFTMPANLGVVDYQPYILSAAEPVMPILNQPLSSAPLSAMPAAVYSPAPAQAGGKVEAKSEPGEEVCKRCGTRRDHDYSFCMHCGHSYAFS